MGGSWGVGHAADEVTFVVDVAGFGTLPMMLDGNKLLMGEAYAARVDGELKLAGVAWLAAPGKSLSPSASRLMASSCGC